MSFPHSLQGPAKGEITHFCLGNISEFGGMGRVPLTSFQKVEAPSREKRIRPEQGKGRRSAQFLANFQDQFGQSPEEFHLSFLSDLSPVAYTHSVISNYYLIPLLNFETLWPSTLDHCQTPKLGQSKQELFPDEVS